MSELEAALSVRRATAGANTVGGGVEKAVAPIHSRRVQRQWHLGQLVVLEGKHRTGERLCYGFGHCCWDRVETPPITSS